jgi:hypothetical protein
MTNMPDSSAASGDSPKPAQPHKPKRGAFPTPKSEIDKAEPYIPATGEKEDYPEADHDQLADAEGEQEG